MIIKRYCFIMNLNVVSLCFEEHGGDVTESAVAHSLDLGDANQLLMDNFMAA